jgi:hypothetical protein
MTIFLAQKTQRIYDCESCYFNTCNKYDFNKHLLTRKHLNTIKYNENATKNAICENFTCECGKSYPYKASLFNHKKHCKHLEEKEENIIITDENGEIDYKSMFITIIKENKELHKILLTQQNQIGELIPKVGNNNKYKLNN